MRSGDRLKSIEVSLRPKTVGEGSVGKLSSDSRSRQGLSPRTSAASTPNNDFLLRLLERELFNASLQSWLQEKLSLEEDGCADCEPPFQPEELRQLDYAIEGILFQQLQQMPSVLEKSEMCLAVEDFLHAGAQGLWEAFWSSDKSPLPFFVTGSDGLNMKQLQRGEKGRAGWPQCAAVIRKNNGGENPLWEHTGAFVLVMDELGSGLFPPPDIIGDAVFFGLQMLLSRILACQNPAIQKNRDTAYILVVDSRCGGVITLKGDAGKLDINNSADMCKSATEWVREHARLSVSKVHRVWNSFGNANWRDMGTLHLLMSLFFCIEQFTGIPDKSIAQAALEHNLRLHHRRIERGLQEEVQEVTEIEEEMQEPERMELEAGAVLWIEDSVWQRGFKIHEELGDGHGLVYKVASLDDAERSLNVFIGGHPLQLDPSWEDVSTWYRVQRQTRVLNIMRQRGTSSKYLPQLVASGKTLHPGSCTKKSSESQCHHPWCGTPALVTSPVGQNLDTIFETEGVFTSEDALKCCHNCLSALRSASSVGIQHGDITPGHVTRVVGENGNAFYVLIEWGHAVLEEKDSPAINLGFSSTYALQEGRLCPASDAESLVYLLFFLCGGTTPQFDSIESALKWRERAWARRSIQLHLGEVSTLLKAFADYVDSLCGTPYPVDYDIWLRRLDRALHTEHCVMILRSENIAG